MSRTSPNSKPKQKPNPNRGSLGGTLKKAKTGEAEVNDKMT
jgi:hypothetical protein